MAESRDPSRTARIDWSGAGLAVLGLGGVVFGLLEWPPRGAGDPLVLTALATGMSSLLLFVIVERGAANPMLSLSLFRSRTFMLANLLTSLLYAALAVVFFLVPLNLIQVQSYTATEAGAALLPFPLIMFALSRWSGGLVARVGSRLPLTVGPAVAALGIGLYARPDIGGSYWATFFPAVAVLGLGMAVTVAPLTTTVMSAVESEHAGVASGVNNAVSRVAGLLAVAVLGVILVRTFDARVRPSLDALGLPTAIRTAIEHELPKMAGADVDGAVAIDSSLRAPIRGAIAGAFVSAFRVAMMGASAIALMAGIAGASLQSFQEAVPRRLTSRYRKHSTR
jgi:predicted MFS family arabinose efflux permease